MLEYYRGMLLANVGWGSGTRWVATWDSVRTPLADLGPHWADDFHVWRMDWDPDRIRLFVDDRLLNETLLADTIDRSRHTDPFHQPHYILLNLAVGGTTAEIRRRRRSLRGSRSTTCGCFREIANRK